MGGVLGSFCERRAPAVKQQLVARIPGDAESAVDVPLVNAGLSSASASSGSAVVEQPPPKASDGDRFWKWCNEALELTSGGTQGMSDEDMLKMPRAFTGLWTYRFSGPLRPAYVTPQMKMPGGIEAPDYALDPFGICRVERAPGAQTQIPIIKGRDLKELRTACRLGREVLDIASTFMRPGIRGDEIDRIVFQACVDRKIYPSPLNYYCFPKSLCISVNEVICHGIPDCRPIEDGDIVNLDVTIYYNGFHSDLNETFLIGNVDEDGQRVVKAAYESLRAASKLMRPGTFYRDLGNVIQSQAERLGCAVVTSYTGHGIGRLFHGCPRIPHYKKNKAIGVMKPGHVFCVEPMVNDGSDGSDVHWPDKWTAVTRSGRRSAAFEHTFIVTETGVEVLTSRHGVDRSSMPQYDPAMFQISSK